MCQQYDDVVPAAGMVRQQDPEAAGLLRQARQLRQEGKTGKAVTLLKRIRTEHPLSPEAPQARYMLAGIHESKGEYRDAFKEYGKIIDCYQDSPLYSEALNRQLAMATSAANGGMKVKVLWWQVDVETSLVKEWLQSIIDRAPYNDTSATAASILGKYLYDHEKYEDARQVYSKLVEDYPDSRYAPQAQLMVAAIWAQDHTRGNRDQVNLANAREAYDEFTLRFPNHPEAKRARQESANVDRLLVSQALEVGRYYLERSHEYSSAIFCFEDVIRKESVNPQAAAEARKLLVVARQRAAAQQQEDAKANAGGGVSKFINLLKR